MERDHFPGSHTRLATLHHLDGSGDFRHISAVLLLMARLPGHPADRGNPGTRRCDRWPVDLVCADARPRAPPRRGMDHICPYGCFLCFGPARLVPTLRGT